MLSTLDTHSYIFGVIHRLQTAVTLLMAVAAAEVVKRGIVSHGGHHQATSYQNVHIESHGSVPYKAGGGGFEHLSGGHGYESVVSHAAAGGFEHLPSAGVELGADHGLSAGFEGVGHIGGGYEGAVGLEGGFGGHHELGGGFAGAEGFGDLHH